MARVPSDPAQVIVNHASFRVQLGANSGRALSLDETAQLPVVPQSAAAGGKRRLAPVVWSGHSQPGDPLAGELLQAVRRAGAATAAGASGGGGTQVLPRIDETTVLPPVVGRQRAAEAPTGLLSGVRPARGAYDQGDDEQQVGYVRAAGYGDADYDDSDGSEGSDGSDRDGRDRRGDAVKHAWYPGRRMNLGIVLLPLRIFLGFVSIYAGMGKLCDRVYFDGGRRGSMVTWLNSLHPWAVAEPLRDTALNHPVGAGLSIAFLQVVVGVLTICGLWQRVAAAFGATLSIALLVTVSWRTVPVYDAPDFIYLAAWSPLVIAGAPVYSIDGHLAGDAWRRLGPRVSVWDLRRRVLRRGTVLASVIVGLSLVIGSVLGAAVRASTAPGHRTGPAVTPTNVLPGQPLPEVSSGGSTPAAVAPSPGAGAKARRKAPGATKQPPTKAPGATAPGAHTAPPGAVVVTPRSTGTGGTSSAPTQSGSGGTSSTPQKPPPPPSSQQAPPPPPPAAQPPAPPKPTQGTIGGLLGSHSPTGLLLGFGASRSGPPSNTA
jgi:uncharacterized membrane protein YphA (DoxX/SURF4 family)